MSPKILDKRLGYLCASKAKNIKRKRKNNNPKENNAQERKRKRMKMSSVPWAYPSFLNITQMSPKILDKRLGYLCASKKRDSKEGKIQTSGTKK